MVFFFRAYYTTFRLHNNTGMMNFTTDCMGRCMTFWWSRSEDGIPCRPAVVLDNRQWRERLHATRPKRVLSLEHDCQKLLHDTQNTFIKVK